MISYELLSTTYVEQFKDLFKQAFGREPDLRNMTALLAIEDGRIIGFTGLYAVTVIDSMWISPEWRYKGIWRKMLKAIMALPWKAGEGFYLFAARKREEALAKLFGGSRKQFTVWGKKF